MYQLVYAKMGDNKQPPSLNNPASKTHTTCRYY